MTAASHVRVHHKRQGFTLIELVAALVLLSVLMVALTGIVPRFTNRKDDASAPHRSAQERTARLLLDRLARDFSAAESATVDHAILALRGTASSAVAGTDSGVTHEIRYTVERRANRHCLIRAHNGRTELLCCGEFRLDIRSFADDGTAVDLVALDASAAQAGSAEIPLASWLELSLVEIGGDLLAQTSVIREPASSALLQVYEERR